MPFRTWPTKKKSSSLFPEDEKTASPSTPTALTAFIDGGARGNPGPSGYGVHIKDASGATVAELSEYLGHQTNNVAEYSGLIAALQYAVKHGHPSLSVVSDSELLVKQMRGDYKVKSPELKVLYDQARPLIRKLEHFEIRHVLRAQNKDADRLANAAMDKGMGRAPSPAGSTEKPAEFTGIVRNGNIELLSGELPEGTRVRVRVIKP
ncbi:MAG TPA: ribonuclease HI family protein [Terriglobales bacterium]|nr:ribonuclease HI family protein [Terriglobales bacterium]